MSDDSAPKATHEGTMEIMGVTLRTYRLDDGRTIIDADDVHRLWRVMSNGDHEHEHREK